MAGPTRKREDLTDWIQEACIDRARELGITNSTAAEDLAGANLISAMHVHDYLSRRKSMGSHLLQHLLRYLGLRLAPTSPRGLTALKPRPTPTPDGPPANPTRSEG